MHTYELKVAGLTRQLPICKVTDQLYIGAFICFGDAELTVACARELLKLVPADSYDYLFTAEAKSIPLIHEMARQSGAKKYFIARKGAKVYMPDPISVEDQSITTAGVQKLYLGQDDAELIRGKRILIMDDVISTGGSLLAMEALVERAGGTVAGKIGYRRRARPRSARTSASSRRCRCSMPMGASRPENGPIRSVLTKGRRGSIAPAPAFHIVQGRHLLYVRYPSRIREAATASTTFFRFLAFLPLFIKI